MCVRIRVGGWRIRSRRRRRIRSRRRWKRGTQIQIQIQIGIRVLRKRVEEFVHIKRGSSAWLIQSSRRSHQLDTKLTDWYRDLIDYIWWKWICIFRFDRYRFRERRRIGRGEKKKALPYCCPDWDPRCIEKPQMERVIVYMYTQLVGEEDFLETKPWRRRRRWVRNNLF